MLGRSSAVIPALVATVCLLVGPSLAAAEWSELAWDDGDLGFWDTPFMTGRGGQMLAVAFEPPEWARVIVGAKFYIHNDQQDNPVDPSLPSSLPFLVRVWSPSGSLHDPPGAPAIDGVSTSECSQYPYYIPEDEWLEVELDVPLLLEPGGQPVVFFVGMEWQHRFNPLIGRDISYEPHFTSWHWTWFSWELRTESDVMIRALVADESGTPVELESWGRVKARYRER
jgi:hypothetical protein